MHILGIANAAKKMADNESRDFILKNYYKQIGFPKENSYKR